MSITAVALPTPVQEGMIYQSLVANDPRLYNEQLTLILHGTLDSALFQQSVDLLVLNHSVLRSSYVHEGVTRSQAVILRERGIGVQWIDLTGLDAGEQETRLLSIRDELQCRPFDFVKEPLLRFTVCSVAPDESVVVLGFTTLSWMAGAFRSSSRNYSTRTLGLLGGRSRSRSMMISPST